MHIYIKAVLEHCCILEGYKLIMLIKKNAVAEFRRCIFSEWHQSLFILFLEKSSQVVPMVAAWRQSKWFFFLKKAAVVHPPALQHAHRHQAPGKMFPGSVSFRQRQHLRHAAPPPLHSHSHTYTHTPAPPHPALSHCFTCTVGGFVDCFVTVRCMPKFR